jgi:hypothetical protein
MRDEVKIYRVHSAHLKRPAPAGPWGKVKRAYRLAIVHALLALADGHAWNALAIAALGALSQIPPELLSAHSWLRTAAPVSLLLIGMVPKVLGNHTAALEKTS